MAPPRATAGSAASQAIASDCSLTTALSPLGNVAILPSTLRDYSTRVVGLCHWARSNHLDWNDLISLDLVVTEFLNYQASRGVSGEEGSKLLAALKHLSLSPRIRDLRVDLPRAVRARRGWLRLSPSRQRMPLPRTCMLAILGYLMYGATRFDQRWQMCLCVYLSFVCYLRPCEARNLLGDNLVPPTSAAGAGYQHRGLLLSDQSRGLRGKTGATDESVIVDNDAWLHPLLEMFRRTRRPAAPL